MTRVRGQGSGVLALRTGTRLDGRYDIQAAIAAGGFGITYMAKHRALDKICAIKEHFPRQFAYRDGQTDIVTPTDEATFRWALDRFLAESRALVRCEHPNVVRVTDIFEANGTAYMALDYEDGQSLANWLKSLGRLPSQMELDALLVPLLSALEYVHAQGLMHRDIAPDNIMLRTNGTPCLIDFGAARQAIAERSQLMSSIVKSGYSPLEQYSSQGRSQGPWSDIYALGATLYRALTGRTPTEATQRQLQDDLPKLADVFGGQGDYRASFLAAVDHALVLKPTERPQSVAAWRRQLLDGVVEPLRHDRQAPPMAALDMVPQEASRPESSRPQTDSGPVAETSRPSADASIEIHTPIAAGVMQSSEPLAGSGPPEVSRNQSGRRFGTAFYAAAVALVVILGFAWAFFAPSGRQSAPVSAKAGSDSARTASEQLKTEQRKPEDAGLERLAAQARQKQEAEARERAEAEARSRADAAARAQQAQREEEARRERDRADAVAREASERAQQAEVKRQADEAAARAKDEARSADEAQRKTEEAKAERDRADAAAREASERAKEAEAKRQADAAAARAREQARIAEEARRKAEEARKEREAAAAAEIRRKAREEVKRSAEAEARRKAAEQARAVAEKKPPARSASSCGCDDVCNKASFYGWVNRQLCSQCRSKCQ